MRAKTEWQDVYSLDTLRFRGSYILKLFDELNKKLNSVLHELV